ncbi:MAG: nuclear transport factor 2 family protein [Myxococcota bacterium]
MSNPLDPANARTAIANLMFTYAERIDGGDFKSLAQLFSKARIIGPKGDVQGTGADEIEKIYLRSTQVYEDGTPMTEHVTTNLIFEFAPDGRSCEVRSRFTVIQALDDFPMQPIISGYYEDRFAYTEADGWHFTERRMKPKLAGDLSRHLKYELKDA